MRDLLTVYLLLGLGFMVSLFHFLLQVFTGNDDSDTVVYNALSPPVTTMFVRVLPIAWNSRISMRIELYGCPGNLSKLRRSGCYKFAISTYLILKRFLLSSGWSCLYSKTIKRRPFCFPCQSFGC